MSGLFTYTISEEEKQRTILAIWGNNVVAKSYPGLLDHFFRYFVLQTLASSTSSPRRLPSVPVHLTPINTYEQLHSILSVLKINHGMSRRELRGLLETDDLKNHDISSALDLAVRVMLMISCRSSIHSITTGYGQRPAWKETESLSALVERVLPRHELEPFETFERSEPIKTHKLRARYLRDYAHISIKWTDNLPDHLFLEVTEEWKSIQLFGHPGYLVAALRALDEEDDIESLQNSLTRGCLTPQCLSETLRTIRLLFPENDAESFKYIEQEVAKNGLDPYLLKPLEIFCGLQERPQSLPPPEDIHDLFEQFPHWGERLYKVIREVENPTPMLWYERWSDRRSSPRSMYWAAVIALGFAVFFGLAATVLGVLQVVITYCTWLGDDQTDTCLALKRKGASE